jgi:MAP/microtubule affinity-regulating kinase
MIMEYAAGGELYKYVEERQRVAEIEGRRIISQIINAMSYCHNRGIVHRDLKLENVLFKSEGDLLVKVVDFGIAGVCAGGKKDKVDAGSIAYMPPETFKAQAQTSPAIDVWAIGVMMYAMLYGHLPFWGDTEDEFIERIINAPLKFDADVPVTQECKEMIRGML